MAQQDLTPQLRTRLNRVERAVGFFVEVGGVRVERAHHAVEGAGHQLLAVHRFDIAGLDQAIDVGQLAQFGHRQGGLRLALGERRKLHGHGRADHRAGGQQACVPEPRAHPLSESVHRESSINRRGNAPPHGRASEHGQFVNEV